jgi:hypothetical protein
LGHTTLRYRTRRLRRSRRLRYRCARHALRLLVVISVLYALFVFAR